MKTESGDLNRPCSPTVLAASTVFIPEMHCEGSELPSLAFGSLGPHTAVKRRANRRQTSRDDSIVNTVFWGRALSGEQIRIRHFSDGADSRCQLRLTGMVRERWLDTLPRKFVTEPAVYLLTRRSVLGNRLMRERWGEDVFRRHLGGLGSLAHLLAINDVRVRVERACRDKGWTLKCCLQSEELSPLLSSSGLIPDAYFQIQRPMNGQERTAGFFLELERVAKSGRVVRSKLECYGHLAFSGRYPQTFGTRSMRVLFVFAGDDQGTTMRLRKGLADAIRLGLPIACFAALAELKTRSPEACLEQPLWFRSGSDSPVSLFSTASDRQD